MRALFLVRAPVDMGNELIKEHQKGAAEPAAKPKKRVLSFSGRSFLKKNTSAAPAAVDMKIIEKPNIVSAVFVIDNLLTFYLLTFAAVILPRLAIIFIACAPAALFARQGLFAFYNLYS